MTRADFEQLQAELAETPRELAPLVDGLGEADWRWKPSAAQFSVLEHVCHLRDIEQEGYAPRIRRILDEREPLLADLDGDRLARERDYNRQNPAAALEAFDSARAANLSIVREVPLERLVRAGVLENVGRVTLEDLLLRWRDHDADHREQLSALRERLSATGRAPRQTA